MIWLKTVTMAFGIFGMQSATLTETVVPGKMADCIKYIDHLQNNPDSSRALTDSTRLDETAIIQHSKMGWSTVSTIRKCVEVK